MSRWQGRVEELLYDGESIHETVDVGASQVVVTSHRVLAFTPDADGEQFRQADIPNVDGVEAGTSTDDRWLRYGLRFGIGGGVLAVTGFLVDFGSIFGDVQFDTESAGQVGAGGLISAAQTLIDLMARLDFLLLVSGLLSLFLAAVFVGVYLFERDPTLVVEVAGDEADIHLPRSDDAAGTRRRLEAAIFPDTTSASAGGTGGGFDDGLASTDEGADTTSTESQWD